MEAAVREGEELRRQIDAARRAAADTTLPDVGQSVPAIDVHVKCRRVLKGTMGHTGKIYSLAWCDDSERVLSAAQDGKLMVWDARDGAKLGVASLKSNWVMTCAYSPSGTYVASGGLDNICSIFEVEKMQSDQVEPTKELNGHAGFLSCCRFLDDRQMLTSSGDGTMILWDIERGVKVGDFLGHGGDVTSIGILRSKNAIATCSIDRTVKIWDMRSRQCVQSMIGHTGDINSISVFPNEEAVGTASDDCSARLFDLRADQQIAIYAHQDLVAGLSSLAFSASGRLLFGAYYDNTVQVWDTLRCERIAVLFGHESRVSSIGVSKNGMALCTASWDQTLRVWN